MDCAEKTDKLSEMLLPEVEMRDDGLYDVTCPNGHSFVAAIQAQKFEILFDLGAMALIDGYPREAISSIAASLERFYEFYIRVIALKHNIPEEQFTSSWKYVSVQSERQFGAFIFAYLLDRKTECRAVINNSKPNIADQSRQETRTWIEFRNDVIHKGYIPSMAEALEYCNLVYQFIYELIDELKSDSNTYVQRATALHVGRALEPAGGRRIVTVGIPTLVSLALAERPGDTFAETLEGLKKYKRAFYDA